MQKYVRLALARHTVWDIGNRTLYDLCARHPHHREIDCIVAKVWLIGRSYAAAIERRRDKGEVGSDDFYLKVVGPTIKQARVDAWFRNLHSLRQPDSAVAVPVHAKLTRLFSVISGIEKRSLASKYLHFHFPEAFYIFDARAAKAIRSLTSRRGIQSLLSGEIDDQYRRFYGRCEEFRDRLESLLGEPLSPRDVDTVLLDVAGRL